MTAADLNAALDRMGISQAALCALVGKLAGTPITPRTVSRWSTGAVDIPPLASAFIRLLEAFPGIERQQLLNVPTTHWRKGRPPGIRIYDRACQQCGKQPITGYKFCSDTCRQLAKEKAA